MTYYTIVDTETSGLFDFSKPAHAEGQPRLAQLVMITVDENLDEIETKNFYIKPDGWEMTGEALAANKLTTEYLTENGIPVNEALDAYVAAIERGDVIVAFNAQYDTKVMRGELRRNERDDLFESTKNICVMRPLVPICQIPRAKGGGFKFPKLAEALVHFDYPAPDDETHDALFDARGALSILRELIRLDKLPEASVHYAKNRPEEA